MPSKEILRIRNCIHVTVISYFHLQLVSKSVSRKFLGLKLVKLDCTIIYLDLDTIKKARNERDGVCGLPLIKSRVVQGKWKGYYEMSFENDLIFQK